MGRRGDAETRQLIPTAGRGDAETRRRERRSRERAKMLCPNVSKSMRRKSLPPAHRQFRRAEATLPRREDATVWFPPRPPTRCAAREESDNRTLLLRANRANFQQETKPALQPERDFEFSIEESRSLAVCRSRASVVQFRI